MDISFITPCFNSEKTILDTLECVRREGADFDYEHIIMDAGSTDGTEDVVQDFHSAQVRFFQEPDEGAYDGMNRGIAKARGQLVAILNSDDYYTEGAVKRVVEASRAKPDRSLICGNTRLVFRGAREPEVKVPDLTWRGKWGINPPVWHPSMFARKEVYERVGVYDLSYPIAADIDFFFRALDAGEKAIHVDDVLTVMRAGGLSTVAFHDTPVEMMRIHRARHGINGIASQLFYYRNPRFRGHRSTPSERWKYWRWAIADFIGKDS